MGIFLEDAALEQAILAMLGFFGLALLGWLLVQLIYWDSLLQQNRGTWLKTIQRSGRQLRTLRRALEKAQNMPAVPLPASLQRKWRVIGWITTVLSAAKWARS